MSVRNFSTQMARVMPLGPLSKMPEVGATCFTKGDISAFHENGAICIRGLVSSEECTKMGTATNRLVKKERHKLQEAQRFDDSYEHTGGFNAVLMSQRDPDFLSFAKNTQITNIMCEFLYSKDLLLLYDQLVVKARIHTQPTHWHYDMIGWPLQGTQFASVWVSLDNVKPEGGILQFVRGSNHVPWTETPDVENKRGKDFDVMGVDYMNAGDAMLFFATTLHGAGGNLSTATRRAISLRFIADDIQLDLSKQNVNEHILAYTKGVFMSKLLKAS